MILPKKSLGQHWLNDQATLKEICQAANLTKKDTVVEVGPGQGALTKHLIAAAGRTIAVEKDEKLAAYLSEQNYENLEVISGDILKFDFTALPPNYKVIGNIPYYLTSHLVRILSETPNIPQMAVLLLQQEVAQRIAAKPGQMSLLSVGSQLFFEPLLGIKVPAEKFEPPPKVDSQLIILKKRPKPLFGNIDTERFFRIVKAGFSGRRKKLRSSLAAGLRIDKHIADKLLGLAGIDGDLRAQNLSLKDWHRVYKASDIIKKYE